MLGALLRLGTAHEVFAGDPVQRGRVVLDGTDGYYHLRRAWLTLADWPRVPQRDPFLGPPAGGSISWPPLFDGTLAALAKVYPGDPAAALEAVGARLPVLLGLAQVLLAATLARRLAGPRAGIVAALVAAILPAVVRYTLLGALDHDPAVELLTMAALLGLADALEFTPEGLPPEGGEREGARPPSRWRPLRQALLVAASLAALPLTWAGSEVHLALVALALLGAALAGGLRAAAPAGAVLAIGGALAALVVAPWAATSVWSGLAAGAFAGLSWLHVAALCALAVAGLVVAACGHAHLSRRALRTAAGAGGLAAIALIAMAPTTLAPLAAGLRFVGGRDPFLAAVAESRPLLSLFGSFDPRPALVRLSLLPLALPLLLAWVRGRRDAALGFSGAWTAGAVALALLQARYSHTAGLALAVLAGLAWERLRSPSLRLLLVASLLPSGAAYVSLPGFAGMRVYGRSADLATTGMAEVTAFLAVASPPPPAWSHPRAEAFDAVLAPWAYGHWIHWRARLPTLSNPFGPYGQTGFADGERFWLLADERAAAALLRQHRVRWVVAPTSPQPPWDVAALAGDDPRPWRAEGPESDDRFLRTMGARLAWSRDVPFLREVYRTRLSRRLPDGTLEPLLRVYEVRPQDRELTAPRRAPSGP